MITQRPTLSMASRCFIIAAGRAARWSPARAWATSIYAMLVPVAIEFCASPNVGLSFLYLASAALAVWCLGGRNGMILALGVLFLAWGIKHLQWSSGAFVEPPSSYVQAWNALTRFCSIGLLALAVGSLRGVLALERWRASTDDLTGALNKAAFEREMQRLLARIRNRDGALMMAYVDLDGFKAVNDLHGHSAGDTVLRSFAAAAAASLRPGDLFARLGGDEFVVLMMVPSCEQGDRAAEMLHRRLTDLLAETGHPVTCSMGAVVMSSRDAAFDDKVIEHADALMYEAKRSGKNALRVSRGTPVSPALRAAYQPLHDDALEQFLNRIDLAERRVHWWSRRAA